MLYYNNSKTIDVRRGQFRVIPVQLHQGTKLLLEQGQGRNGIDVQI